MRFSDVVKYYAKEDIRSAMLASALQREVVPSYGLKGFGKRPHVVLNEQEFYDLARRGATSFHASEEHWLNPLNLENTRTRREQDELRAGWDLLFDIDTKNFVWAKKTAQLITEYLTEINRIKNVYIKFSGNNGFHIGVPFESFPKMFGKQPVSRLFPELPRIIAAHIKEKITKHLEKEIGPKPFSRVEIDTIFIASRHLFRMPYSLHEKSGLASVPLFVDEIFDFEKNKALPPRVEGLRTFLTKGSEGEAKNLFEDAYFWNAEQEALQDKTKVEITKPKEAISEEHFPPCIKTALKGVQDGRKRSLFILLNFLKACGWSFEQIEKRIFEWNNKNYEPLREGYVITQLNWHKKLKAEYPPPNCPLQQADTQNYYVALRICAPDNLCKRIKNPASYPYQRLKHTWKK
ncbi:hypothetical protein COT72_05085 [archaeon CG10_big_fil_rev_8_21_14_0_10_43_11]|nr:MAG: hypothetical protein COT72_05085 [archaeon CG10_big_fil_rev_8_21_14_0_10_43_11]